MAYVNVYPQRINWENEPSINTPINDVNLNKIDYAVYEHDRTFANWDTTKANQSDLLLSVKTIEYDDDTGVFVFTWQNGTTKTVDLNIEKIPVSFSMNAQGVITMTTDDGTQYTADVGALIKTYTFTDSSVIDFTVTTDGSGNKTITADIVDGSITGSKLQPNYLADCQAAQTGAETAQGLSEDSAEDSEAWAVGQRNGVDVPSTDPAYNNNSKYWAEHTSASLVGLNDVRVTNPQDKQALTYDAESGKWINGQAAGGTDTIKWSEATTSVKKNLLLNNAVSQTVNGVTFTVNSDGSVKANGTATANIYIKLCDAVSLERTQYRLSGNSFPTSNCALYAENHSTGATSTPWANYNNVESVLDVTSDNYTSAFWLSITSGTTLSNQIIKPMLRLASIEDDTYVPYIPDNTELVSYKDNAILGAKNLLPNNAVSQTKNGVTFTVNSDGSVTANGTATALTIIDSGDIEVKRGQPYILSGGASANCRIDIRNANGQTWTNNTESKEVISPVTSSSIDTFTPNSDETVYVKIRVPNGAVINNETVYPMIRLATDTDDTYVPYAKTNKELTDDITKTSKTTITQNGLTVDFVKKGFVVQMTISGGSLTSAISANATMITIPSGYEPLSMYGFNSLSVISSLNRQGRFYAKTEGVIQPSDNLAVGDSIRASAIYIAKN